MTSLFGDLQSGRCLLLLHARNVPLTEFPSRRHIDVLDLLISAVNLISTVPVRARVPFMNF
jgi:hypothetical protein